VSEYVESEEPRLLRRLNKTLSSKLKRALVCRETRTIGYPQGHFQAKVCFLSHHGNDVLYWSGRLSSDETMAVNFFGHGSPGGKASLNIDIQFNLPNSRILAQIGRSVSTARPDRSDCPSASWHRDAWSRPRAEICSFR
jgi:hypothetical protein